MAISNYLAHVHPPVGDVPRLRPASSRVPVPDGDLGALSALEVFRPRREGEGG